MITKDRTDPFATDLADRNVYLVVLITVGMALLTLYQWLQLFLDQGQYLYDAIQYNFLRELLFLLLTLAGAYFLYQKRTRGWVILTLLLTVGLLTSLRLVGLVLLARAGYDWTGLGAVSELSSLLPTMLFGLVLTGIPLYLLLRRDTRRALAILPQTLQLTLGLAVGLALLEIIAFYLAAR